MLRNRPFCYVLRCIRPQATPLPIKHQGLLITNGRDSWWHPYGAVSDPILFAVYVSEFADNRATDHVNYAGDIKVIVPPPESKRLLLKAPLPQVLNGPLNGS